jgi:AmiR/NasT family two-component response regulator
MLTSTRTDAYGSWIALDSSSATGISNQAASSSGKSVTLTTRAVIDQAIGIMMSRNGGTPDEALDRLRTFSQQWNRKLVDVAQRIVAAAVRRAERPDV